MKRPALMRFMIMFWACTALLIFPGLPGAQESGQPAQPAVSERQQAVDGLEKRIAQERDHIQQFKDRLGAMPEEAKRIKTQLNDYRVMSSAVSALLTQAGVPTTELENGRNGLQSAIDRVAQLTANLKADFQKSGEQLVQVKDQYLLQEKAVQDLKVGGDNDQLTNRLVTDMKTLVDLLGAKRDLLEKIHSATGERLSEVQQAEESFRALQEKMVQRIVENKKRELFTRSDELLSANWREAVSAEVLRLKNSFVSLFTPGFWVGEGRGVLVSGGYLAIRSLLLFLIVLLLLLRLRRGLSTLKSRPILDHRPWLATALSLLHRSLPLLGATLFLYGYGNTKTLFTSMPFTRTIFYLFTVWLFTSWSARFLQMCAEQKEPLVTDRVASRLSRLIRAVRAAAIIYVIGSWLLEDKAVLLLGMRVVLEICLVLWCVSFWRDLRRENEPRSASSGKRRKAARFFLEAGSYTIAAGGAFIELAGYGGLAVHWYVCWGRTAMVLLWGIVSFLALHEFAPSGVGEITVPERHRPIRWLVFHVCRLLWLALFGFSLLLAWGASHTILVGVYSSLSTRVGVGNLKFSLLGIVHAFIVLLITHTVVQLWRPILLKRVLSRSGLEMGLQESISTISAYCIWVIGIVAALNAFGLSMATMAVAIGALGIGLGFGLQNIFNNFISGIILLFERPVQVGDVVEVDGIWGRIEKINVRATVVQTFENASLIIPNSAFISEQVKNWSFRDLRVRRSINVGVAYGSDIKLVRETLLEVATAHPQVLKAPPPDVLFLDFGDSALAFRLRIWSTVNGFYATETDLRFEIDRLFRERGISIPFPQRDVHIVSGFDGRKEDTTKEERSPEPDGTGCREE